MAYKFEDKFVHFRWDDSLKGKKVFYADSISALEEDVAEGEDIRVLIGAGDTLAYPFLIEVEGGASPTNWKFVYYDSNYEVKLAYDEGKLIEQRSNIDGEWYVDVQPTWEEWVEYRIKPEENSEVNGKKTLEWTDLNVGDIIETFIGQYHKAMVTQIDFDDDCWNKHIYAGNLWLSDVDLRDWRKVKND